MEENTKECTNQLYDVIENTDINFRSNIGRKYSVSDVKLVWKKLSEWVKQSLLNNKGVLIKDLGEFTLSEWELYVGLIPSMKITQPVFILSQKLVDFFHLKRIQLYTSHKVPQQLINFGIVATLSKCDRYMAEDCITEVIQALTKLLREGNNIVLDFPEVGQLKIINKKVSFNFSDELLEK